MLLLLLLGLLLLWQLVLLLLLVVVLLVLRLRWGLPPQAAFLGMLADGPLGLRRRCQPFRGRRGGKTAWSLG